MKSALRLLFISSVYLSVLLAEKTCKDPETSRLIQNSDLIGKLWKIKDSSEVVWRSLSQVNFGIELANEGMR